jgi:hypothetical protein
VTEGEWLACTDPKLMVAFLRGKASDRKLRLFAVASFGRLAALLPDPLQRRGIEVLEKLAEGSVTKAARRDVTREVRQAIPPDDWVAGALPTDDPHFIGLMLYREFRSSSVAVHAALATAGLADGAVEQHAQARLLRDIAGPSPFRSLTVAAPWLAWNDSDVAKLAQGVYEERAFDRLPILGDALEEAGCDDRDILDHCRSEGPHVRGCWAVDLLLGKE